MQCVIPQPKDKGILLRDVLEKDVPKKYYLSDKMLQYFKNRAANFNQGKVNIREKDGKASCLTSSMASCDISDNFIRVDSNFQSEKENSFAKIKKDEYTDLSNTLFGSIKFGRTDEAKQLRKQSVAKGKDHTPHGMKQINGFDFDKMNTLTTATNKDNLVIQLNISTESGGVQPYQQNRVFDPNGISPALLAQMSCGTHAILEDGAKIRRLTPVECERLQCVPDNYSSVVSDSQRYKMLGNGWNVDTIVHIFSFMDLNAFNHD
jgi:DNA (cytosine-5)-methyltransferase 3A